MCNEIEEELKHEQRERSGQAKASKHTPFLTPHHTFKPAINSTIPDFAKLQSEFSEQLQATKDMNAISATGVSNDHNA